MLLGRCSLPRRLFLLYSSLLFLRLNTRDHKSNNERQPATFARTAKAKAALWVVPDTCTPCARRRLNATTATVKIRTNSDVSTAARCARTRSSRIRYDTIRYLDVLVGLVLDHLDVAQVHNQRRQPPRLVELHQPVLARRPERQLTSPHDNNNKMFSNTRRKANKETDRQHQAAP